VSRRYTEVVEVPVLGPGAPPDEVAVQSDVGRAPARFVWRGRLHVVRDVLAHWVEVGPWWRDLDAPGDREREVWRVEAAAGRSATPGVYDLACDATGRWTLARLYD
jgi:hypothetical protein